MKTAAKKARYREPPLRLFYLLVMMVCPLHLTAAPEAVYLTWQDDPTTTMMVRWITRSDDKDKDTVAFAERDNADVTWLSAPAISEPMPEGGAYVIHSAELTGLKPGTAYRFRVGNTPDTYAFATLPFRLEKPLTFAVGGDIYHRNLNLVRGTSRHAAKFDPAFVLLGGDIAYACDKLSLRRENVERWVALLRSFTKDLVTDDERLIPIMATLGNHDVKERYHQRASRAKCFHATFPCPSKTGYGKLACGDYLMILLLNSDHTADVAGEQTAWLEKILLDHLDTTHKFALYHIPAYPARKNKKAAISKRIRKHWVPLFEKYGVSAAFENHEHLYKRTHPLSGGMESPNGILYLGGGGWGAKPRKPRNANDIDYLAVTHRERHFLVITIDNNNQSFQAVNDSGTTFDSTQRTTRTPTFSLAPPVVTYSPR